MTLYPPPATPRPRTPSGSVLTAKDLGARLREERQAQGLSLQAVEEKSLGLWKAVVVGSYERGDRNGTVERIAELMDFYGTLRLAIVGGDEAVVPIHDSAADEAVVEFGVSVGGKVYPASDPESAQQIADLIDGAEVCQRTVQRGSWNPAWKLNA